VIAISPATFTLGLPGRGQCSTVLYMQWIGNDRPDVSKHTGVGGFQHAALRTSAGGHYGREETNQS
jgi:hypothetical protein